MGNDNMDTTGSYDQQHPLWNQYHDDLGIMIKVSVRSQLRPIQKRKKKQYKKDSDIIMNTYSELVTAQ